jgi:hypothetical protein|tara:strand:- start:2652 stop:3233 length:582 start_codon:yes stop_codon:yes gene_type:complete
MKIMSSEETVKWEISGTIHKVLIDDEELLQKLENKIRYNIDDKISYETNVKGRMTHWDTFKKDDTFKKMISKFFHTCSYYGLFQGAKSKDNLFHFFINNAWGNILKKEEKVVRHHHLGVDYASVLYFDDYSPLCTDAGKIETKRGLVVTIPSYLYHWVEPLDKDIERCTIAWNWSFTKKWDLPHVQHQEEILK